MEKLRIYRYSVARMVRIPTYVRGAMDDISAIV